MSVIEPPIPLIASLVSRGIGAEKLPPELIGRSDSYAIWIY
jgi:hypothetical protein